MPNILVVDDHQDTAEIMATLVRRMGYEATCAYNGQQAIAHLRAAPVSLVLLDVMMPGMSGLQLLEQLRHDEQLRSVPVVIHSAYCDPRTQSEALRLGAVAYILKEALPLQKIREVIETFAGKAGGRESTATVAGRSPMVGSQSQI
jgi:CheY-like chemotaxis protein